MLDRYRSAPLGKAMGAFEPFLHDGITAKRNARSQKREKTMGTCLPIRHKSFVGSAQFIVDRLLVVFQAFGKCFKPVRSCGTARSVHVILVVLVARPFARPTVLNGQQ